MASTPQHPRDDGDAGDERQQDAPRHHQPLDGEGPDALELTITYRVRSLTVDKRPVRAQALPSLALAADVPLPPSRLELLDGDGHVIYRRALPRPGQLEVHTSGHRWTAATTPQVLVALVPALADARRVVADAVAIGRWLDEPLP